MEEIEQKIQKILDRINAEPIEIWESNEKDENGKTAMDRIAIELKNIIMETAKSKGLMISEGGIMMFVINWLPFVLSGRKKRQIPTVTHNFSSIFATYLEGKKIELLMRSDEAKLIVNSDGNPRGHCLLHFDGTEKDKLIFEPLANEGLKQKEELEPTAYIEFDEFGLWKEVRLDYVNQISEESEDGKISAPYKRIIKNEDGTIGEESGYTIYMAFEPGVDYPSASTSRQAKNILEILYPVGIPMPNEIAEDIQFDLEEILFHAFRELYTQAEKLAEQFQLGSHGK